MRTSGLVVGSFVGAVAVLAGCKGTPPAPAEGRGDAGAPVVSVSAAAASAGPGADGGDAAAIAPGDRTLRVVAESDLTTSEVAVTADDRLIVTSGPFVYEPRPDGSLELIGGATAYAPLYGGNEDTVIGYLPPHPRVVRVVASAGGGLEARLFPDAAGGFRLEKGALAPLEAKFFETDAGPWASRGTLPVGALEASTVLPALTGPSAAATKCRRLPAFDGRSYASCRTRGAAGAPGKLSFHVKDGEAYKPAFAAATSVDDKATIGADGALYVAGIGAKSSEAAVFRCSEGAGCEKLAIDIGQEKNDAGAPPPAAPPSYASSITDVIESDSEQARSWQSFSIEATRPAPGQLQIEQVFARSAGDVWIVARKDGFEGGRFILHSGAARPRARLASDLDARVLVRNHRPPSVWVGHCDQVFVRMAGARGDAPLPVDAIKAKVSDIKATLSARGAGDDFYALFGWTLVEGRLHEERVVGIVVRRTDAEGNLARMERAVERLVDKLTTNPMSRPQVYCTLPVLSAVLASGSV